MGLIILLVISLVIAIFTGITSWDGWIDGILNFLLGAMLSFLIWIIIGVICIANPVGTEPRYDQKIEVYALADAQLSEGNFYLGRGCIDEELTYTFVKKGEYGYTVEQVKAEKSYVEYTSEQPYAVPIIEKYNGFTKFWCGDSEERIGYIFYLPEGSIIDGYNIDLE